MGKLAFLFPGQGSQYCGMGRDLSEAFAESRQVFDEANAALGFSMSDMCYTASLEELKQTENTQPSILTVSVAAYRALEKRGVKPDFVAGHSLGEYSGLVAAGGLGFFFGCETGSRSRALHAGSRARSVKARWPRFLACRQPKFLKFAKKPLTTKWSLPRT